MREGGGGGAGRIGWFQLTSKAKRTDSETEISYSL